MTQTLEVHLAELKARLLAAGDFSACSGYFLDHVAPLVAGEVRASPLLDGVIAAVACKRLGLASPLILMRCLHVAEHGFWHGGGMIGTYMSHFFYFEGEGVGLLSLVRTDAKRTEFLRFSTVLLEGTASPDSFDMN
jgi:hypothetical protein